MSLSEVHRAYSLADVWSAMKDVPPDELRDQRTGGITPDWHNALALCAQRIRDARGPVFDLLTGAKERPQELPALLTAFREHLAVLLGETRERVDTGVTANAPTNSESAMQLQAADRSLVDRFLEALCADPSRTNDWPVFADLLEEHGLQGQFFRSAEWQTFWRGIPAAYDRQLRRFMQTPEIPTPPPLEQALNSFSLEQWLAVEHLRQPALLLVPPLDFSVCCSLLGRGQIPPRESMSVHGVYTQYEHPAPRVWQAWVVESEQNISERPADLNQDVVEHVSEEERTRPAHVNGMDRYRYAWLMVDSRNLGWPVDSGTQTILNADAAYQAGCHGVPIAFSIPVIERVYFDWYQFRQDHRLPRGRLRRAVGGDISG